MPFVFCSVYLMDHIYGFPYVEPTLYPWDEAYFIVMGKLLCTDGFGLLVFVEDLFASMFIKDIGLKFSFCCISTRFWYQDDAGFIECVSKESLLFNFLE